MKESSSDMEVAVAALFLGEGKEELEMEEALMAISVKRRWFSPDLARKFMEKAVSSGLVKERDGKISPTFDYRSVDVPFGYYPDESILETGEEKEEMPEEALSLDYPFTDEVKFLIYLMRKGEDIQGRLESAENDLIKKR